MPRAPPNTAGGQPAEHAPVTAVRQHLPGEPVLSDPGRRHPGHDGRRVDAAVFVLGPAGGCLQVSGVEFALAEQLEFAAALQAREVGESVHADPLSPPGGQYQPVNPREPG